MTRVTFAVAFMVACGGATPARQPDANAISDAGKTMTMTPPSIHDAFVARELALVMKKSPVHSIPPSVFVFLGEPARIDAQKTQPWMVARDAVFEVADDGLVAPEPFTAFPPDGSTCVGHAKQKVLLRTGIDGASPKVQRGMVLEGCTPSSNTLAFW